MGHVQTYSDFSGKNKYKHYKLHTWQILISSLLNKLTDDFTLEANKLKCQYVSRNDW